MIGPSAKGFGYGKDARRVYYSGQVIEGADPATFVVDKADPQRASDKTSTYQYGKIASKSARAANWYHPRHEEPFMCGLQLMTLSIPGVVGLETDAHGLSFFRFTNALAEARVYLLGAHVAHFQPTGQEPILWLSPLSAFQTGKAIRGGVPLCWPWFGPHPSRNDLPAHGLARTREWTPLDAAQLSDGRTRVRLSLKDDADTRAAWPHVFALTLTVTVGNAIDLELTTTNTGTEPFSYADALHTYLRVSDLSETRVEGLEGAPYVHSTRGHRGVQSGPVKFAGEVNHIFVPNRRVVHAVDATKKRTIEVAKSGSEATVVWNPGAEVGGAVKDIGEHWNEFICLEAANCADTRVLLLPGTSHTTSQTLRTVLPI